MNDVLASMGLDAAKLAFPDLTLAPGEELVLPFAGAPWTRATVSVVETDLDHYKARIGRPDPTGALVPAPLDLGRDPVATLTYHYLFVDSRAVAEHKAALERRYGRFPLTLVTAGRIELCSGAHLFLRRGPLLLLARSLILHEGGELTLETVTRAAIDEVFKVQEPQHAH